MSEFVLDSSVTVAWGFDDEASSYAGAVLNRLPTAKAYVPIIWPIEIANALLVGERQGRITVANTVKFLALLSTFPITVNNETTVQAWNDTINVARTYKLSAYDGSYLELAMRKGLPLATIDEKLKIAARKAGVTIYVVSRS